MKMQKDLTREEDSNLQENKINWSWKTAKNDMLLGDFNSKLKEEQGVR